MSPDPTDYIGKVNPQSLFDSNYARVALNGVDWGKRIKQCREHRGLTQAQLAERIGVSQQTVGGYESQTDPKEPSLSTFVKIGEALNSNPAWLAFGIGEREGAGAPETRHIDRQLMEETVIAYERFVLKKGFGERALTPEKKANMLIFAYELADKLGGAQNLEEAFERLFALASRS